MLHALRTTFRSLLHAPGHLVACALTLALGLAASLGALAPAWDRLAFPFDFREPGRVVALSGEGADRGDFLRPLARKDLDVLARELRGLSHLGACRDDQVELVGPEGPVFHRTALVNPDFLPALGLPLALGRSFTAEEMLPGGPRVLVLTHGFWQRHFGGDPGVLGRTLRAVEGDHQIVGVLAPQKSLPAFLQDVIALQPLRTQDPCWIYGRLGKGQSLASLQAELDRLSPHLGPARPAQDRTWSIRAYGLVAYFRSRAAAGVILPLAAGLLILFLACANVAHLILAKHLARVREWGVRAALGAGLRGLGAPILMEALFLCVAGFLLALPLLQGLAVLELLGRDLPGLVPALGVLLLALLLTTLLPLRWARRLDLTGALKEGGAASASRASTRLRGGLVALQVGLAFALLVVAGLSLRALERLQGVDPGYDLRRLHAAFFRLEAREGENFMARSAAFQRALIHSVRDLPGVEASAMASTRALVDQGHDLDLVADSGVGTVRVGHHDIDPGYLATLRLPLVAGRNLSSEDKDACLVSAALARRCWGDSPALGRTLRLGDLRGQPHTVVGVVGEARMSRFSREPLPAVYTPLAASGRGYLTLYARTSMSAQDLRTILEEAGGRADTGARLLDLDRLEYLASRELEGPRTRRRQTLVAGLLAACLAGVGLAGTLGQMVARQRREWGVRAALGASPAALMRTLLRHTLAYLLPGVLLGFALAWALGRLLGTILPGLGALDIGILLQAILPLGTAALLATVVPVMRLLGQPPSQALRSE